MQVIAGMRRHVPARSRGIMQPKGCVSHDPPGRRHTGSDRRRRTRRVNARGCQGVRDRPLQFPLRMSVSEWRGGRGQAAAQPRKGSGRHACAWRPERSRGATARPAPKVTGWAPCLAARCAHAANSGERCAAKQPPDGGHARGGETAARKADGCKRARAGERPPWERR